MARRANETESTNDRSKVRVFYAEAEGTTQSIQDLMRALTSTMGRPVQVQAPAKLVQSTSTGPSAAKASADAPLFTQDPEPEATIDTGTFEPEPETAPAPPRRKRGEGANRDRNAGLTIVKSLNLRPDGRPSLQEFVSSKKPQSQLEHVAVYIYYLKRVTEESNVGFDHIYTCFKEVGERVPGDLAQTCRNAASQKGWIDTSIAGDLKSTTRGENYVEHEMPRSGGNVENGAK